MPSQNVVLNGNLAGGAITASGVPLTVGGLPVVLEGDSVASHGSSSPHTGSPTMAVGSGSTVLTVRGVAVCFVGSAATCGHTATGGSPKLTVAS